MAENSDGRASELIGHVASLEYSYAPLDSVTRSIRIFTLLPTETSSLPLTRTLTTITEDNSQYDSRGTTLSYKTGNSSRERFLLLPKGPYEDIQIDFVRGTLTSSSLADAHKSYKALSYAWGNASEYKPIVIDGKHLMVAKNLYRALLRLRLQCKEPARLWIDAICINQKDLSERNQQVPLMPKIYSSASEVLIWLHARGAKSVAKVSSIWGLGRRPPPTHESVIDAIEHLIYSDWTRRLWTVQETVLATGPINVIYDSVKIPWNTLLAEMYRNAVLENSALSIHVNCWVERMRLAGAVRANRSRLQPTEASEDWERENSTSMTELIRATLGFHYSEPRDRVYALLGLADESAQASIIPDYKKSLLDLYFDIFDYILTKERRLDVLYMTVGDQFVKHPPPELKGFANVSRVPTWVGFLSAAPRDLDSYRTLRRTSALDWHKPGTNSRKFRTDEEWDLYCQTCFSSSRYELVRSSRASLRIPPIYTINRRKGILSLRGIKLGIISAIAPARDASTAQWFCSAFDIPVSTFKENWWPSFWELLHMGVNTSPAPRLRVEDNNLTMNDSTYDNLTKSPATNRAVFIYEDLFAKRSYLGSTIKEPQVDDFVCLFLGSSVPCIIRPNSEVDVYEIVDVCYVDIAMAGEALFSVLPSELWDDFGRLILKLEQSDLDEISRKEIENQLEALPLGVSIQLG